MNVHGVGHGQAAAHAARKVEVPTAAPPQEAVPSEPTAPVTEEPVTPPSADDIAAQQSGVGLGGPPGLVRKGVTDLTGDGRITGRDVAFAKHGVDHPGRGFQPVNVDPDEPVVDQPPIEVVPDDGDVLEPILEPLVDPLADLVVDTVVEEALPGLNEDES